MFEQLGIATTAVPTHDGPIAGLALNGHFLAWLLLADSVKQAQQRAYDVARGIQFDGAQYRRDIGFRALKS